MDMFKPDRRLESKRLVLSKHSHANDSEMWQAIDECRTYLREYLFWVDSTLTPEDVSDSTERFFARWTDDKEWAYVIRHKEDGRLLGCIGAHNIDFRNRTVELGYWLRLSENKNGYMTEAVERLEQELFEKGMHRVTICCDVNNKPSTAVAKRAGYELEVIMKEATYHYTGLQDKMQFVKFSPYPIKGF